MQHKGFTLILLTLALAAGCADSAEPPPPSEFSEVIMRTEIPAELETGAQLFASNCSACHGERGLGTNQGPPLVHIIYEPSHHADIAFLYAVQRGVRAHHWQFGDMPPIPSLGMDDITEIVAYVRFLQRQVGIV